MSNANLEIIMKEFSNINEQFSQLEEKYRNFQSSQSETVKNQNYCTKQISSLTNKIKLLISAFKGYKSSDEKEIVMKSETISSLKSKKSELSEMERSLPGVKDFYLRIVLGSVNVQFPDNEMKFKYKDQYENFKLTVNAVILLISLLDLMSHYRFVDAILHFLLVWYHCTLTIQESILIANGSRIKGWWRAVQFINLTEAGIMIVWPDGLMYTKFRNQFLSYIIYISIVQFFQCYYQRGCLYRLRALGERYEMDVSISGFHSWMWRGLSFILPFLYLGYVFQLHNAITLYNLSNHVQCTEWQVIVVSVIFFILFFGNTFTTSLVIKQKLTDDIQERLKSKKK